MLDRNTFYHGHKSLETCLFSHILLSYHNMEGEEAVCWSESGGIKGKGEWERERESVIF